MRKFLIICIIFASLLFILVKADGANIVANVNVVSLNCADGTSYNECSSQKPLFCINGSLINNCQQCGCPSSNKNIFSCKDEYISYTLQSDCNSACSSGYELVSCTKYFFVVYKATCRKIWQTSCVSNPSCSPGIKINETFCGESFICQPDGSCKAECSCSSWQSGSCGAGGCLAAQRQYTRTCTPSGCDATSKCVDDATCTSTKKIFTCKSTKYSSCSFTCSASKCPSGYTFKGCSTSGCYFGMKKAMCEKTYDTSCSSSPSCGSDAKVSERSC